MKKRKFGRKLSRGSGARRALYRSLIAALVEHGSIETTKAKAKIIQPQVDKLVSKAKYTDVAKRRKVYATLGNDRITTDRLFNDVATKFGDRNGGYTRIVNLPNRRGDSAKMARIEWVKEISVDKKDGKVKTKESKKETQKKDKKKK